MTNEEFRAKYAVAANQRRQFRLRHPEWKHLSRQELEIKMEEERLELEKQRLNQPPVPDKWIDDKEDELDVLKYLGLDKKP